jgi:hypothetical protein
MFGITPLGWVHTLGSLPAIPVAVYMFVRYGKIVPRSRAGAVYFFSILIGAITAFLVAHQPVSYGIAAATLVFLLSGYGIGKFPNVGRAAKYIETIFLTMTMFLLIVPTVTETLRRVPDGHPFVTDLKSPLLLGLQAGLLVMLIIGLSAQLIYLHKNLRTQTA